MAQYSDGALEFWSKREVQVWTDYCPTCGQESYTSICEHCDFDIAKYYEKLDIVEAHKYILRVQI